jgi:tetratricopeptide (TPR) repeat protein
VRSISRALRLTLAFPAPFSYRKAMTLGPRRASYVSNSAAALAALGRRREACAACIDAISIEPSFERPRQRLGALAATSDGLADCIHAASAAAAAAPECHVIGNVLEQATWASRARADGAALFARGQYMAAEAAFSDGIERGEITQPFGFPAAPGAALLLYNRAMSRAAQARFREAVNGAPQRCMCAAAWARRAQSADMRVRCARLGQGAGDCAHRAGVRGAQGDAGARAEPRHGVQRGCG